jgi:hypothetical protein
VAAAILLSVWVWLVVRQPATPEKLKAWVSYEKQQAPKRPWLDVAFFHGASGTKKDSPVPRKESKRRFAWSQEDTEPQQSSQNRAGDADGSGAKTKAILKN